MKDIAVVVGLTFVLISSLTQSSLQIMDQFTVYENPIYGFKIHYPSSWERKVFYPLSYENPTTSFLVNFSSPKSFTPSENSSAKITIHVENVSSQSIELDEYNYQEIRHLEETSSSFSLVGANTTTLAGKPAYQVQYTETLVQGTYGTYQIWTMDHGKIYRISYTAKTQEFPNYISTAQKMINSFGIVK